MGRSTEPAKPFELDITERLTRIETNQRWMWIAIAAVILSVWGSAHITALTGLVGG